MKRELNSRSRRKWVVGGALVFGSVALLTTGFATWVIGATQAASEDDVNLSVDTINDGSYIVTATISDMKVGEQANVSEGSIMTVTDSLPSNLKATLDSVVVTVGKGSSARPGSTIAVSLPTTKLDESTPSGKEFLNVGTLYANTNNKTGLHDGATLTYLTFADQDISVGANASSAWYWNESEDGNNKVYTLTKGTAETMPTVSFAWGSYFEEKAPSAYYNAAGDLLTTAAQKAELATKAKIEMETMETALTGKTITLLATVNKAA